MARLLSVTEFLAMFPNDEACWQHLRQARWGEGFQCPRCGETEHWGFIRTRKLFQCNACQYQASVTAGTIMEDTKLSLTTWFLAAYFVLTTKKGISSPDLARKLGTTQTTAYFLHQKLARVVQRRYGRQLFGLVEVDESYVGGKGNKPGRSTDKPLVVGLVEDKGDSAGNARLVHVPNASKAVLEPVVVANVHRGARVKTDGWASYEDLVHHGYRHEPHVQEHYTQAAENLPWVHILFANLKRVMTGVHTKAAPDKLQSYLDVFTYRLNHRADLGAGLALGLAAMVCTPPARRAEIKTGTPASLLEPTETPM